MIKLPMAVGLFTLLPLSAWATPVVSSPIAGIASLSEAQRGLVFGGFFTLYSFVVAGPVSPATTGADTHALAAVAEPGFDSPPAHALSDDLDPVPDAEAPPTKRPPKPAAPAFVRSGVVADPLGKLPTPDMVEASPSYGPPLIFVANEVPEPSTLLLAGLAVLALVGASGRNRAASRLG